MYEPGSRYHSLETALIDVLGADGQPRVIAYTRRRFIPPTDDQTMLVEHVVRDGDRLDNLTARYLGDPAQFWRVCDANNVARPDEITEQPGRSIAIALPAT